MSLHTRIPISIWTWEPWLALEPTARIVWLALYTTASAKRCVPGLWHGTPSTLAEDAGMSHQDVQAALGEMVDKKMVEWDRRVKVMRLTMLPDDSERPMNANGIKSWWRRFQTIPECGVRNRHVDLLRWLVGTMTDNHAVAWDGTFGTVPSKPLGLPRPTEQRRVTAQADLFDSDHLRNRSRNGSSNLWVIGSSGSDLGSEISAGARDLSTGDIAPLVTPPAERVLAVVAEVVEVPPAPVLQAVLALPSPAPVVRTPPIAVPVALAEPPPAPEPPVDPLEAVIAALADEVPPPAAVLALTIPGVLEALVATSRGRVLSAFDDRLTGSLDMALGRAAAAGYAIADVEHMGRWLGAGGDAWRGDIGPAWFAKAGNLVEALEKAKRWRPGMAIGPPGSAAARAGPPPPARLVGDPLPAPIPLEKRAGAVELAFALDYLGIAKNP